MDDKANFYESKGRAKLAKLIKNTNLYLKFYKFKYSKLDAYISGTGVSYGVEIKDRKKEYESFDTYIFESTKYGAMKEGIESGTYNDCLMVYFYGSTAYIFRFWTIQRLLDEGIVKFETKQLPHYTMYESPNIDKTIINLPKKYAFKYENIGEKSQCKTKPEPITKKENNKNIN